MNTRLPAFKLLKSVLIDGRSLSFAADTDPFSKALCFEVCRHHFALQKIISCLLDKPLKNKDQDLGIVLMMGLIQIEKMAVKDHAALNESVSLVEKIGKKSAKGLINACLRHYQKDRDNLAKIFELPKYKAPTWLIEKLKAAYPENWTDIVMANQEHAPMFIRVNQKKNSIADYQKLLNEVEVDGELTAVDGALKLTEAVDVSRLPGFAKGASSVQDLAPQLAAGLLNLQAGQNVLDACAAPGNKSIHLLETEPQISLTCLDSDQSRLERLEKNFKRCQQSANIVCSPAEAIDEWWDQKPFDRILLDAPCSATGVIRRHPDIQMLRREEDIAELVQIQALLLERLWKTLKPGGLMVYATCSILPQENEAQIAAFIEKTADVEVKKLSLPFGNPQKHGVQILPESDGADGFYYCGLIKKN